MEAKKNGASMNIGKDVVVLAAATPRWTLQEQQNVSGCRTCPPDLPQNQTLHAGR